MPRYHFNICDGYSVADTDGTELPNLGAARLSAIRLAGAVLAEEAHKLPDHSDWHLNLTDETGLVLFRLDFCVSEAISTRSVDRAQREHSSTH